MSLSTIHYFRIGLTDNKVATTASLSFRLYQRNYGQSSPCHKSQHIYLDCALISHYCGGSPTPWHTWNVWDLICWYWTDVFVRRTWTNFLYTTRDTATRTEQPTYGEVNHWLDFLSFSRSRDLISQIFQKACKLKRWLITKKVYFHFIYNAFTVIWTTIGFFASIIITVLPWNQNILGHSWPILAGA